MIQIIGRRLGLKFKIKKMDHITFDKLLLKTAFCCMASDGHIDDREVAVIKSMCQNSPLFEDLDFLKEINILVDKINAGGKKYIMYYLDRLKTASLTEEEELTLIDFAIQTIRADDQVEYEEIKFFKVIRHHLSVSDERILEAFPDIEQFLEKDIITESFLDKITKQYLDTAELPQFESIASFTSGPDN